MANTAIGPRPPPCSASTIALSYHLLLHLLLWSSSAPSPVSSQGSTAAAADAERRALLQMKAAWGDPPSLSSWSSSSFPCSGRYWTGVECGDDGSVTGIALVDQNIHGGVPAATCFLRNLTSLNLYNNSVGGEFPTSLYDCSGLRLLNLSQNLFVGAIPADVHRLSELQVLDLSYNNFSGDVPPALGRIAGLLQLRLERNLLNGTFFPKELGGLAKLEHLSLGGNPFKPMALPAELGDLGTLQYLWVGEANVVGEIPESLGGLVQLQHLDLSINRLTGGVPGGIWRLRRLQMVYLYDNHLSGRIAGAGEETFYATNYLNIRIFFAALTQLQHLDLSMNRLTGGIPGGIWRLRQLQMVYLYDNHLSGRISGAGAGEETFDATNLTEVDLSMNQLSGPIPEEFAMQPNLRILYLYKNQLSGTIPGGLGDIPTLYDIRLFDNNLTGVLPPALGKKSKLLNLEVCGNQLSGELPGDLCAGGALNTLVVFNNRFTGGLPESLGDCRSLKNLQVHGNGFSGDVPAGIWTLPMLSVVLMHGNRRLSGELPRTLPGTLSRVEIENNRFSGELPSSAQSLKVFRGSNNLFSGEIPADLTGVAELQELLLDRNRISGEVPAGIRALQSLATLNLSGNVLSGEIPAEMGSLPVLTALDLSGNQLTGEIPPAMGSLRLNFLNLSSNSLTGRIPPALDNQGYDRSFFSNSGLCSSNSILNLPPCGRASSGRSSKGFITLFWVLGAVFFLAALLLVAFFVRDLRRRRKHSSDVSSWKLTSFHSLDFAEANIVRGMTAENLVGAGGSGQVFRVALGNRAGEVVAVKKIWNSKKLDSKLEKEFEAEVQILGSIRHANIVKLLCCISGADSKLLVYEFMENGSLDQWLHGSPPAPEGTMFLDWPARLRIAVGAAQGLCYMHHDSSPAVVHRDVKSSNILLDGELKAKVADFGLARILVRSGEPETVSAVAGSFGYMAPECAYTRKVNEKIDVYSFGVVLLELTTGRRANDGGGGDGEGSLADWAWRHFQEGNSVANALDKRIGNPLYAEEMAAVLRLGVICTGSLPSTRPTMKEVLQVLLRCAQAHEEFDKAAVQEYDAAPLLRDARKKGGSRKRPPPYGAGDGEDEESRLACNV